MTVSCKVHKMAACIWRSFWKNSFLLDELGDALDFNITWWSWWTVVCNNKVFGFT